MPAKKDYKKKASSKKTASKRFKKVYKKKNPVSTMFVTGNSIIPDRTLVSLPFCDIQNQLPQSGFPEYGSKAYTINSLWDPEPSAFNTSAMGLQEWVNFYTRYRVYSVSYEITLFNGSNDTAVSGALYFRPNGAPYTPQVGDVSTWLTQPHSRKFYIGNRDGGKSTVVLKGKISLPQLLGLTSEQYRTSPLTAANNMVSSPVTQILMTINTISTNPSVSAASIQMSTKLVYHTEMFQRTTVGPPSTVTGGDVLDAT